QQELAAEEPSLLHLAGLPRLGGADREQLALVVPVVQRLVEVDALVALQPDQARAGRVRERTRNLGLADARFTLEKQRLRERLGEENARCQSAIGQVVIGRQDFLDVLYGRERHLLDVRRLLPRRAPSWSAPVRGASCIPAMR